VETSDGGCGEHSIAKCETACPRDPSPAETQGVERQISVMSRGGFLSTSDHTSFQKNKNRRRGGAEVREEEEEEEERK